MFAKHCGYFWFTNRQANDKSFTELHDKTHWNEGYFHNQKCFNMSFNSTLFTPWKINMEPENQLFGKEIRNNIFQTCIVKGSM